MVKDKNSAGSPANGAPLVFAATEHEAALTAVGALRAYIDGDQETLNVYRTVFAEGYLELGAMSLGLGVILSCEDPELELQEVRLALKNQDSATARFLSSAAAVINDKPYSPTSRQAISEADWLGLLKVSTALIGRRVFGEVSFTVILDTLHEGLLAHLGKSNPI